MENLPADPCTRSTGPNDAYFGAVVVRWLVLCGGAAALGVLGVSAAFWPHWPKLPTASLVKDIGYGYENYLMDGGDVSDVSSQKEWTDRLLHNPRGIVYVSLASDCLDVDGFVIDSWGRRLRIKSLGHGKVEIRSAGRDGRFHSADDVFGVHPREKAG